MSTLQHILRTFTHRVAAITSNSRYHSSARAISLAASIVAGSIACAQSTTSGITGTVGDAKGETLPGASVVALLPTTGQSYSNLTNIDGKYNLVNLDPGGPYTISAAFMGYQPWKAENVYLKLGETLKLDITLEPTSTELKTVEVTGNKNDHVLTGTGTSIGREQLQTLPTLSRSFSDMTRLTPQSSNNSFAGSNFRYNNISLDGAVNNDAIGFSPSLGGISGTANAPGSSTRSNSFSLDAIQEVQVAIAPYDVSLGNFTGGSINAVSRRGTNFVTGSVYGFGRNNSITGPYSGIGQVGDGKLSTDYYDYQTGLRVGFPIIKNKLFFFTNEEITRNQIPTQFPAGSPGYFMTQDIANQITDHLAAMPASTFNPAGGYNPGTSGLYNIYAKSTKFFNRVDWTINAKNSLSIRNNTVISEATNLEHSSTEFQFANYDFLQKNTNSSTVAELKSTLTEKTSNKLIVGYTTITDVRDPLAIFPQVQINNVNGGGTVFLGTNREAGIFNMKQGTFEFTDNLKYFSGNHKFTFGTHNELYHIQYGFINSWNGRFDYNSLSDFLADKPARMRGIYNPGDNSRDGNFANTPAVYNVDMYSLYAQDEWDLTKKLTLTYGVRADLTIIPNGPPSASHSKFPDNVADYGNTYNYANKVSQLDNNSFGKPSISPRIGFNYDVKGDRSVVLRGGSGLFTGRIPFAWIGYTYVNSGSTFAAFDYSPSSGTVVPIPTNQTQFSNFAQSVGAGGRVELDVLDKNFVMPQIWRSNLAVDIKLPKDYVLTLEGLYTKTIKDVMIQQVNLKDSSYYASYDTNHQQPLYLSGGPTGNRVSNTFSSVYLITNTDQGQRFQLTAQIKKSYKWGLDVMAAYTYGESKDILNGIRNSPESGWQVNQALNANNPQLAWSNFDIRHRIISSVGWNKAWNDHTTTHVAFLFSDESGSPFTWVIGSNNLTRNGQQVDLAFIPANQSQIHLVNKTDGQGNVTETAQHQWDQLNTFISNDAYLSSRRGKFTERNGGRTPWNNRLDMRVMQDINLTSGARKHTLQISLDIINLTNLLNKDWGVAYFTPNTRNSSVNTGLSVTRSNSSSADPTYTYTTPTATYSIDQFSSRWQMQLGLRYSF